jgi:hypothetical protein
MFVEKAFNTYLKRTFGACVLDTEKERERNYKRNSPSRTEIKTGKNPNCNYKKKNKGDKMYILVAKPSDTIKKKKALCTYIYAVVIAKKHFLGARVAHSGGDCRYIFICRYDILTVR